MSADASPLEGLRLYPMSDVMRALHVGRDTMMAALATGALVGVELPGKKVRFTEDNVRDWLRSCETEPTDWRVK